MLPDDKGFEGRSDLGIYHHFTVAIDTDNIKRVFADVRDMGSVVLKIIFIIFFKFNFILKTTKKSIERKHGSTNATIIITLFQTTNLINQTQKTKKFL